MCNLSESGGYHAAKDEQGQIEARILSSQHILESARVGGPPRTDGVVGSGMTVTVRFVEDDEEVTFLLASRQESSTLAGRLLIIPVLAITTASIHVGTEDVGIAVHGHES